MKRLDYYLPPLACCWALPALASSPATAATGPDPVWGWTVGALLVGALLYFGRRLFSPRGNHLDKWLVVALLPTIIVWVQYAATLSQVGQALVMLIVVPLLVVVVARDTRVDRTGT